MAFIAVLCVVCALAGFGFWTIVTLALAALVLAQFLYLGWIAVMARGEQRSRDEVDPARRKVSSGSVIKTRHDEAH
ncbi:hypothetical protein FGG78_08925 [Thioclava sp. BHET1]|nr:hypothetical protein FGG78_08925 [Thioclava sp. BHET1]